MAAPLNHAHWLAEINNILNNYIPQRSGIVLQQLKGKDLITPHLVEATIDNLRETFRHGYTRRDLFADLQAGLVVGVVAIPLSMALAIATGVPPWHGLYTAVVAGVVIALLGGSRTQVSGPTAAFVAVLAPIVAEHGVGGLLVATVLAGLILMLLGLARLGRFVEFVPHPVTIGFTAVEGDRLRAYLRKWKAEVGVFFEGVGWVAVEPVSNVVDQCFLRFWQDEVQDRVVRASLGASSS